MKFIEILKKIGVWLKIFLVKLLHRLKPRATFRWIFSAVIWLAILSYLGGGVYFSLKIYKDKVNTAPVKISTYFYPFPAAFVGGKLIWAKDYYRQLTYIEHFAAKTKQAMPDPAVLRGQIIDQLAENEILEFQALRYNLHVSNKDVNEAYQKIVAQSGGVSEVRKVLNELYGMSEREFKILVRQQVVKEKIRDNLIAQIQVAHIFIKDEGRAKEIADRAKKGEDFAALAKEFSEDTKSRDAGGELGWISKGQLVADNQMLPEFDEAAFKASKGEIIGPIKTTPGYEIAKIEDKKGLILENFNTWLEGLKKQAKIWRFIR